MRIKGFHIFRIRYRKHFPPFPSILCTEYCSSDLAVKEYGLRFKNNLQAYDEEKMYVTIGYKEDFKKFGQYFLKRFLKDPRYLANLVKWSEKNKNSLKKYLEDNFSGDIKKLSNEEFWRRLDGYVEKYRHFHLKNTPAWWLGSDPVEAELKKNPKRFKNTGEIFEIITNPLEYKTENFMEEYSLLKIASIAKRKGLDKISEKKIDSEIKKMIARHADNFSYIPFGYNTGVVWSEKYFIGKTNKLLKNDPEKLRRSIAADLKNKIAERKKKIKELKLSKKEITLAEALRALAYLQEIKKATQTKSHPPLNSLVYRELSRRLKVPVRVFDYMSYPEIKESLKTKVSEELKQEIEKRKGVSAVVMTDLTYRWIYGNEVKRILYANNFVQADNKVRAFKGVAASAGYAKGRVFVSVFSTQVNKIKKGDILVAGMTTPDFVPAMKKAAAVITDEGGITSHAAIVSRELKIPCVIGTKIATKILRDGDLVEVDADRGIVKIIGRK